MDVSQILAIIIPVITFVGGAGFTKLLDYLEYRKKREEQSIRDYKNLFKEHLKDYLGPLHGTLFNLMTNIKGLTKNLDVKEPLKELDQELESIFMKNFGVFSLILPSRTIHTILRLRVYLNWIIEGLKKNMIDDAIVKRAIDYGAIILHGFVKAFGLEHLEKINRELFQPIDLDEEIKRLKRL